MGFHLGKSVYLHSIHTYNTESKTTVHVCIYIAVKTAMYYIYIYIYIYTKVLQMQGSTISYHKHVVDGILYYIKQIFLVMIGTVAQE